ncbi:MAG: DUF5615 family PIN-like protein [Cyanobacteria bacterium P01_A01_bin.37]
MRNLTTGNVNPASAQLDIDEDAMRNTFVSALRDANLDIVTVADVNRLGLSDEDQLAWTTEQGSALYSFNVRDFSRLHTKILTMG